MNILVILGLTMPSISDTEVENIRLAAGPNGVVTVASNIGEAMELAQDSEVILGHVPLPLLQKAPKLKWVHSASSGVDIYAYPEFRDSEIVLTGEKGLVGGHLADHGFALLLTMTRNLQRAIKLGPEGWASRAELRADEIELDGLTLGILGFGGTGQAMAKRGRAFGMSCLAVDNNKVEGNDDVVEVWDLDSIPELLSLSDIVAICLPLTAETQGFFNDEVFSQMRKGSFLINVTRGEIVDDKALQRALVSGHIRGAGLDVHTVEPMPADHPFWNYENVVMTPHTAGASQLRSGRNIDRFVQNIGRWRTSEELLGVYDKQAGY
ncbi:MAG TPA: D-2-hydroxyacid dehydrogenase [Dehalococcoidia bacterium]|nr:D-2-hydroxyacid dehydrogenase [Dehalococcoidia bacterium]